MTVVLESERVFFRELLLNDVDPLTALLAQPEASRQNPPSARAFIADQQESYRAEGLGVWAAVHREAGVVVGYAGLRPRADRAAELWCLVDPSYRGSGLGEEIGRAVLTHAFDKLGRERVVASLQPGDKSARRLAEKLGFELEREDAAARLYSLRRSAP